MLLAISEGTQKAFGIRDFLKAEIRNGLSADYELNT